MSSRTVQVASVVAAYFVVSITLVFSNKALLQPGTSIPAPMFVTWFQCVFTFLLIWVLGFLAEKNPTNATLKQFPKQTFDTDIAKKIAPLTLMFVGMVSFNQLCLQYVEVSFYNVARSLTIVANVIFSFFLLGETTSFLTLVCLVIVIVGFFVGADGEVNFSMRGTMFGVVSSVFVSLNSIYTKKVGPVVKGNKWVLAFYNNVNAAIIFIPLIILSGEHLIIMEHVHLFYSTYYWAVMIVAGFLGFAIGIVTVMQITMTSPLTHNIAGTAKACVQTVLALFIYQNDTTAGAMMGVVLVLFGSAFYTWVRQREEEAARRGKEPIPVPLEKVVTQPVPVTSDANQGGATPGTEAQVEPVQPKP